MPAQPIQHRPPTCDNRAYCHSCPGCRRHALDCAARPPSRMCLLNACPDRRRHAPGRYESLFRGLGGRAIFACDVATHSHTHGNIRQKSRASIIKARFSKAGKRGEDSYSLGGGLVLFACDVATHSHTHGNIRQKSRASIIKATFSIAGNRGEDSY